MWKITTGSRLHCGLLETAPGYPFRFGGIGMMVEKPSVVAVLKRSQVSAQIEVAGQLAQERLKKQISLADALSAYHNTRGGTLEIVELPMQHAGFGTGTQIACAAASLIKCQWMSTAHNGSSPLDSDRKVLLEKVWESSTELIQWSGRGKRSTIGAFGFLKGGFIVDHGHNDQGHGQLGSQLDVLEPLTVVLATPKQNSTISGSDEDRMMSVVASQPNPHRQEMWDLISQSIVPAASEKRWDVFGNALHEYGKLAGVQFAGIQGGIYRNDQVADLVARMQSLGLGGVCQSSWGPTAFGLSEDRELASRIAYQLQRYYGNDITIELTQVKNRGADIVLLE
jgi:predicted sugar kinase